MFLHPFGAPLIEKRSDGFILPYKSYIVNRLYMKIRDFYGRKGETVL